MKPFFYVCAALIFVMPAVGGELYVSPTGSAAGTGTFDAPFNSLERARDAAREIDKSEPGETIIYLRGGTYYLDQTLEFDARDSGTDSHPVIYKSYRKETPTLSGGKRIEGWKKSGKMIWEASVKGMDFRQLYVNGEKALRSRSPNPEHYLRVTEWTKENQTIILPPESVRDWDRFEDVEIYIQMMWSIAVMRLDTFSAVDNGLALVVKNPERDLVFKRLFPRKLPDQSFHFENAREFIDLPSEWSLDRQAGICYYLPRSGEDMESVEVIAPQLETLISIQGSYDHPVRHLQFEGLTFTHSNWTLPSRSGYLNLQAGQYSIEPTADNIQYVGRPPAAVYAACVENLVFKRNEFYQLGATGLDIHYGSRDSEVVGNIFHTISGTAISHARLSDPDVEIHTPYNPEDLRDRCVNDWIHNNYIKSVGFDYGGTVGILSGWPTAVRIDHNELRNLAYSGISVGWGWTPKPNAMRDNQIRRNYIDYPMTLFTDGGGIYTLSEMPGTLVQGNVIGNIWDSGWAAGRTSSKSYYFDEHSGGITLDKNLTLEVGRGVERTRFHVPGVFHIKPLLREMFPEIKAQAGIEDEYKDIKEKFIKEK